MDDDDRLSHRWLASISLTAEMAALSAGGGGGDIKKKTRTLAARQADARARALPVQAAAINLCALPLLKLHSARSLSSYVSRTPDPKSIHI